MKTNQENPNVKNLIEYAETEKIWLPEFQRPFVWDKNQIRLLIDSLYHEYTISSILVWYGSDELARRRVGGSIKEIRIPEGKNENVTYLLDGQQRNTALLLAFTDKPVFRGNNIKKKESYNIFWDSEYTGSDPELRWIFDDEKIYLNGDEEPIMLKTFDQINIFKKYDTRFVFLKHAYNLDKDEIKLIAEMGEEKAQSFLYRYQKKINNLNENILYRPITEIEQKGKIEQVLEVFERINTQNTKLSIFDIMVAKTYRKFEKGYFDLRTYFKIINYKEGVKENYFDNIDNLVFDKADLIISEDDLLSLTLIILKKKFKATDILKLDTDLLMGNTKYLHDKFQYLIGFMNQNYNIETQELWKYQPIMKFLSSAISVFDNIDLTRQEFLKKWFWNTLLKNRYPGAQNEKIAKDFERIKVSKDLDKTLEVMIKDNTREYLNIKNCTEDMPEFFDASYSYRSQQIYRAFILLLKSKKAKDFYSGLVPVKSGTYFYLLEEHHIFPTNSSIGKEITNKYKDSKTNDILNNIANIALITKDTNNKRIKAKNPSEYILQFENEYKEQKKYDEFLNIMKSQFISEEMIDLLKKDNFSEFIFQRTMLLLQQIEILCN